MEESSSAAQEEVAEPLRRCCALKELPDCLDEIVYIEESVPYICDTEGNAQRFLSYGAGPRLMAIAAERDLAPERLRTALVASLKGGFPLTIDLGGLPDFDFTPHFDPAHFPKEVFDRQKLFDVEVYGPLLRPRQGDAAPDAFSASADFRLQLVSSLPDPPTCIAEFCTVLHVGNPDGADDGDGDAVEDMVCGREVKKNSPQMAEEAFDGELEEVQKLITQGYHVDSCDGHDHTALSEAAAQGHEEVVRYLLGLGADPNHRNDRGRPPIYRATFNNQLEMMTLLLEHGSDPDVKDNEHATCMDAVHSDEARELLEGWDREKTVALMQERAEEIKRQKSLRIQTAAQRDYEARRSVTEDLLKLVMSGTPEELQARLQTIVDETEADPRPNPRPIATANARDERGHTLLAIAAWKNKVEIVEFLLTHWKTLEPETDFYDPDKVARRVFKAQVNARNLQGFTPISLASFHGNTKVVELLRDHGNADPSLTNKYGKNAFHVVQDQATRDALGGWNDAGMSGAWVQVHGTGMNVSVVTVPLEAVTTGLGIGQMDGSQGDQLELAFDEKHAELLEEQAGGGKATLKKRAAAKKSAKEAKAAAIKRKKEAKAKKAAGGGAKKKAASGGAKKKKGGGAKKKGGAKSSPRKKLDAAKKLDASVAAKGG
jgi:ankyrin repeat protein